MEKAKSSTSADDAGTEYNDFEEKVGLKFFHEEPRSSEAGFAYEPTEASKHCRFFVQPIIDHLKDVMKEGSVLATPLILLCKSYFLYQDNADVSSYAQDYFSCFWSVADILELTFKTPFIKSFKDASSVIAKETSLRTQSYKYMHPWSIFYIVFRERNIHFEYLMCELGCEDFIQVHTLFKTTSRIQGGSFKMENVSFPDVRKIAHHIKIEIEQCKPKKILANFIKSYKLDDTPMTIEFKTHSGCEIDFEGLSPVLPETEPPLAVPLLPCKGVNQTFKNKKLLELYNTIPPHLGMIDIDCALHTADCMLNLRDPTWEDVENKIIVPSLISYMDVSGEDRLTDYLTTCRELVMVENAPREGEGSSDVNELSTKIDALHKTVQSLENSFQRFQSIPIVAQTVNEKTGKPAITSSQSRNAPSTSSGGQGLARFSKNL
nr:MAG: ORF2 protein [Xinmoviridae sp. 2]